MSDTTNTSDPGNDAADPEAGLTVEDAGTTTDPADLAGGDDEQDTDKPADLAG